jgi:RHS repeat-associated protein
MLLTLVVVLEAGAIAPASAVYADISVDVSRDPAPPEAAPLVPLDPPSLPDATNVTCDDFERPDQTGLGVGPIGLWQAFNPPGISSIINGEASLIWGNDGGVGTIRYVDLGSVPLPFEIFIKHRVWLAPTQFNGTAPISVFFGLATGPAFGTTPPDDYYAARYYHIGKFNDPNHPGRWLDSYPRALVGNQTGWTYGPDVREFDTNYTDGTEFYTRLQVSSGDKMYIKDWYVGAQEPTSFFEVPINNPSTAPMRYLVLENLSQYEVPVPPLDPQGEWRIDDICLDRDPPPVLVSEPIPPGTEHNQHPNGETGGDPVDTFTGSFGYTHRDVAIPGRGPAIDFQRTYNSNDPRVGPLGPGWTHNYASRLVLADDQTGDLYLIGPQGRSDRYELNPDGSFTPPSAIHTQLALNPDGTYTATLQDQSTWVFDSGGRLIALRDRYGNSSNLSYAAGKLAAISDPAGRGSLSLGYTSGRLTSLTDWASPVRTVTYQYDGNGRLWKVTDREGKTTTFTYDGTSHRLASLIDARNHVALTLTYEAQGRVQTQKDARGLTTGETTSFGYVINGDGTRVTTITAPPTSFEPSFNPTLVDTYSAQGWITQRVSHPSTTETLSETYSYDADGDRSSVTNPRGNTSDFCYDVDYSGAAISGSFGNLTRVIGPPPTLGANRPVALNAYDAKNNLIQTVSPKGVPSGTNVSCATNLSAINPSYATDLTYDASQTRVLSQTTSYTDPDLGALTAITKYEYIDAANPGLVTRVIPPRGNTGPAPDYTYATTFAYFGSGSKAGLLSSVTDPLGGITTYDYDAVGRRINVVDALGNAVGGVPADHRTEYVYDKEDRIRFTKLPAPVVGGSQLVTETRYDEVGNPIVQIDPKGQVTTRTYDERDALYQLKESPNAWTDPASPPAEVITTEYAHDAAGDLTRMTRAKGDATYERAVDYAYDGRSLVRRETQYPSWPSTVGSLVASTTYDQGGNLASRTDQLSQTTTFGYDTLNRLTSISYDDPATPDVGYTYDANGNRTQMTDGTGETAYSYDQLNRLTSVTSPGPTTVGYRYDRDGNRTRLIYPDATAVTYTIDKADRLSSLLDWGSRQVSYAYWADGLLRTATKPDGSVATYAYDNARRMVDILHTAAGGGVVDRFHYTVDAAGNVATLANGSFDPQLARPDGFVSSNGSWTGTYASINEVTPNDANFLASPAGPTTSNYYEVSLSDVAPPGTLTGIAVRYRYAKAGNNAGQQTNLTVELRQGSTVIASQAHLNIPGITGSGWQQETFTLTPAQAATISDWTNLRVRFRPSTTGSGAKRSAQVSWAEFQVPGHGDPNTLVTYTRDRLDRLTGATDTSGSRNYTYDPAGNRLTSGSTSFTYDRADRMLTSGSAVAVDAKGNMTGVGAATYAFDEANRLRTAAVNGTTETYEYDGDGTRFSRQVGANPAIRYVSDVAGELPLTISDGTRKYVYGLGLDYAVAGSTVEIYHADRLGSPRELTNATGAVTDRYTYTDWGAATHTLGTSQQAFGFTGQASDATGLTYLRARYYNPLLARFASRDIWPGSPTSCQSLNRYAYALDDPVTRTDPSGLKSQALCDLGLTGRIVLGGFLLVAGATIIASGGVVFVAGLAALAEAEAAATVGLAGALALEGSQAVGWTSLLLGFAGGVTAGTGYGIATGCSS